MSVCACGLLVFMHIFSCMFVYVCTVMRECVFVSVCVLYDVFINIIVKK